MIRDKNKRYRKLDNTAKVFSLDDKKNMNTFRYSIVLKEFVDKKLLEQALEKALEDYSAFKVKMKAGIFWNYLEFNANSVIIEEENQNLCKPIDFKKNHDYLFRITYYKNNIHLDIAHLLTDGCGAIEFIKALVCNYLDLKNNYKVKNKKKYNLCYSDCYDKYYYKKLKKCEKSKHAYLLPGKINKGINNMYQYVLNIKEVKSVCKKYKATITEYLTALYIYSIYLSFYKKDSKKEIIISVPISLRNYYSADTLSNFFVCMNINSKICENKLTTFEQVLSEVRHSFKEKLTKENVELYLSRDVKLGKNIAIGLTPLPIKKAFMKYFGTLVSKSATSTLSNVGIIDIDDKYKKHIDNIFALVMPGRVQKMKCTICSFKDNLNITINTSLINTKFEQTFFKLLQSQIREVELNHQIMF